MAFKLAVICTVLATAHFFAIKGAVRMLRIPSISIWKIGWMWLVSFTIFALGFYAVFRIILPENTVPFWKLVFVTSGLSAFMVLWITTSWAFETYARNWKESWFIGLVCAVSNFIVQIGLVLLFRDYPYLVMGE